jgi:hypothetical protein
LSLDASRVGQAALRDAIHALARERRHEARGTGQDAAEGFSA